jgi:hypothetical protein
LKLNFIRQTKKYVITIFILKIVLEGFAILQTVFNMFCLPASSHWNNQVKKAPQAGGGHGAKRLLFIILTTIAGFRTSS